MSEEFVKEPLSNVMTKDPLTISKKESIYRAACLMEEKGVGCLVVTGKEGVEGVITEIDMVKAIPGNAAVAEVSVETAMSSPAITIQQDASVFDATVIMNNHHLRHLVVMEKEELVGVISVRDILYQEGAKKRYWSWMFMVEPIEKVMKSGLISVFKEDSVSSVCQCMVDHKVGSVLINDEGKYIGIFSETDVVRKVIAQGIDPTKIPVSSVMSTPIKTCDAGTKINEVYPLMANANKIRHLVVTLKDRMVGMISARDLLYLATANGAQW